MPSLQYPNPAGGGYFNGGYNTKRHGSKNGGVIDGLQVETYYGYISNTNRANYSRVLGDSIIAYINNFYNINLENDVCQGSCSGDANHDHLVNALDLGRLLSQLGVCLNCLEDINNDGSVNIIDLLSILGHWGQCI